MKALTITITTLVLICMAFKSNSQMVECEKFKTGKFIYPSIPNVVSLRKESTQESYRNGKLEMIWTVKWLTECQYEMICEKIFVDPCPIKKGDRIVATIVKTEGDCFTATLMIYNDNFPKGMSIPGGPMCFEKASNSEYK